MRTFVIGSKKLSVDILHALLRQGHEVLGVYSRDDEPGMRVWHNKLGHPSLKEEAERLGIPCHEGMKVNSDASHKILRSLDLDVVFSCFWSEIFKAPTLGIPKMGVYNLHTAYLPRNRGSRPIPWSLIRGEACTGLTIHKMAAGVDNGPILAQVKVPIGPSDTGKSLYEKVTQAGADLFMEILPSFLSREATIQPQEESEVTYHPRGEPFGGQVNPYWSEEQKDRFRRAFHFPPFRAHREAPAPFIDGVAARVYLVPGILHPHAQYGIPVILLPEGSGSLRRNDIGNPAERKTLKMLFEPLAGPEDIYRGCYIQAREEGLRGMFAIHDVLSQFKVGFVVSETATPTAWARMTRLPQPFRYENGLLEIPALVYEKTVDIKPVLLRAKTMMGEVIRDVFVPVLLKEEAGTEEKLRLLSEEIQNSGGGICSFPEVCKHFDTAYEYVSA